MIRAVVYLIVTVLVLTLLRGVIGLLGRTFMSMSQPEGGGRRTEPRAGGQLRRDPVCGAYVSEEVAVKKTVGKKTFFFCSPACRDKHQEG
jgi:YHS domain-containing protein